MTKENFIPRLDFGGNTDETYEQMIEDMRQDKDGFHMRAAQLLFERYGTRFVEAPFLSIIRNIVDAVNDALKKTLRFE